ncbi:expressed unknown protein [Seminavis robusta]|uniref:gamma-glutamylcyclotransferase n=1 Tax=Seminavis robusta TaxID=568900 RepID=A0A9N8EFV6_9STRA|nr:expressed unknown protein [Seminavis robusta]|eukprot:Sro1033_g233750.1 n/a (418) ;mRNA; f:31976-33229
MKQPSTRSSKDDGVWYFGYGPLVHPMVRHRRGVQVVDEQAAILPNHRLTFAYGGVASVVEQRGYEIHGIVMKCQTHADWEKLQQSEGGYYARDVTVYPYSDVPSEEDLPVFCDSPEQDDPQQQQHDAIRAKVFVMTEVDEAKLDEPLERLPQERYLRLIATGMAKYNCDQDYINDQIMGVSFDPSRTPDNYSKFPVLQLPNPKRHSYGFFPKHASDTDFESASDLSALGLFYHTALPKITWHDYQRLCASESNDNTTMTPKHLYCIVGKYIVLVHNPGKPHPGFQWFKANAMGQKDVTFYLHKTHVDPDIPFCETEHDINPVIHCPWAENLMSLAMGQGLNAYRVFELQSDSSQEDTEDVRIESEHNVELLKAFLQPSSSDHHQNNNNKPQRSNPIKRITSRIKKELRIGRRSSAAT